MSIWSYIQSNLLSQRPDPGGGVGQLFIATDTLEGFRDNGTAWQSLWKTTLDPAVPSFTRATLPAPGTAGRLANVTDDSIEGPRGIYFDTGSAWVRMTDHRINARWFSGVTGRGADNQATGLTAWLNAVKAVQAQGLNFEGYLPSGCYRYDTALPDIAVSGVTITGEGLKSILYNKSTAAALKVTGQNVTLRNFGIEGTAASSHGIRLLESHYLRAENVIVLSCGDAGNGWQIEGVITLTAIDCRGTFNVPGRAWTTDITDNGGRGTPARALNFLDGPLFSNNDHSWVGFKNNGGHSSHGVVIGGTSTGVNFFGGVFEAPPVGFQAILLAGSNVQNCVFISPYISLSTGLGLKINAAHDNVVIGGNSNGKVVLDGDARNNTFINHEMTALDILVNVDTPRMNAFYSCRIAGGAITDNGVNTLFIGMTDNSNFPLDNTKLPGKWTMGTGSAQMEKFLFGSATFDPPSIANGAQTTTTVTVTGAGLGEKDHVVLGFSQDLQGIQLTGYVSGANTVTAVFRNGTGAAVNLASGTLRALIIRAV